MFMSQCCCVSACGSVSDRVSTKLLHFKISVCPHRQSFQVVLVEPLSTVKHLKLLNLFFG